jgi:hypothetical protein
MAIQYKQSQAELLKTVTEVEAAFLAKGKVLHIIDKKELTPEQRDRASANCALVEAHLYQNHRSDGVVNFTFDTLYRTAATLYKAGSLKTESDTSKEYKQVHDYKGMLNHAADKTETEEGPLQRQQRVEASEKDKQAAAEIFRECESVIGLHRHPRNHAVTYRDKDALMTLFKSLYSPTANRATALDVLTQIKTLSRKLGEKHT